MTDPLPRNLAYLDDVVAVMFTMAPDEIDEDFDVSGLVAALRQRIAGMALPVARRALAADRAELLDWLRAHPEHPAHFIAAFMEPPELAGFVRKAKLPKAKPASANATKPKTRLAKPELVPLPGFATATHRGNLVLMAPDCAIVVMPKQAAEFVSEEATTAGLAQAVAATQIGSARGSRYLLAGRWFYFLRDGDVSFIVTIDTAGKPVDLAPLEEHLANLRFA